MKLKKGDTVLVTIGKDKGKKGKVEVVYPQDNRVRVAGVNMYKRHMKRRDDKNPGGILDIPKPLDVGKVALVCPKCGKQTRVGYVVSAKEKVRVCNKCNQHI